uniref:Protease n=1 Tax=Hemiscolopendra marginata TaxID=943146 RepID=A0A646QIV3_9MYRI
MMPKVNFYVKMQIKNIELIVLLLFTARSASTNEKCDECGQSRHLSKRIVGGERAAIEKFPWMVELRPRLESIACGGALINRCFVLTAAHCFKWEPDKEIIITLGTDQYLYTKATVRKAVEKIRFPTYNHTAHHDDIMLVRLNESVNYNEDIQPICLPDPSYNYTGEIAMVMGFGVQSYRGLASKTLRAVDLEVVSHIQCQKIFKPIEILPTNLCAGGEEGKDACQGDSGSPLVVNHNGHYSIIGIVSWGTHCAQKGFPGVYTRVSAYLSWIKNITRQYQECCSVEIVHN